MRKKIILFICVILTGCLIRTQDYWSTREPQKYGEYIKPIDIDRLERNLRYKQDMYDRNHTTVSRYIDDFYFAVKQKNIREESFLKISIIGL